jgi:salicylate hydroxylase
VAKSNGRDLPVLVVGGGIGGLAAAYALSLKGFPVRVLEQSSEFREVGAGIQLGPNVFRALERLGLKDAVLADAWRPGAQEMRDALTGERITRIPIGDAFFARFEQPYGVTHRHDIHAAFLHACQSTNLISLETSRKVDDFADNGETVTALLNGGERVEGRALIGCDGLWSTVRNKILGDGPPRVSGHIAYRAVLRREDVPADLCVRPDAALSGPAPRSAASARTHRDLALLGAVRPRADQGLEQGAHHAARRCRPSHAAISGAGREHGDRGCGMARGKNGRAAR